MNQHHARVVVEELAHIRADIDNTREYANVLDKRLSTLREALGLPDDMLEFEEQD